MHRQGSVVTQSGTRERRRALLERQGQGAHAYARVFPILEIVYELLSLGKTASQRDIYYRCIASAPSREYWESESARLWERNLGRGHSASSEQCSIPMQASKQQCCSVTPAW